LVVRFEERAQGCECGHEHVVDERARHVAGQTRGAGGDGGEDVERELFGVLGGGACGFAAGDGGHDDTRGMRRRNAGEDVYACTGNYGLGESSERERIS
jgi:hypothetical protein